MAKKVKDLGCHCEEVDTTDVAILESVKNRPIPFVWFKMSLIASCAIVFISMIPFSVVYAEYVGCTQADAYAVQSFPASMPSITCVGNCVLGGAGIEDVYYNWYPGGPGGTCNMHGWNYGHWCGCSYGGAFWTKYNYKDTYPVVGYKQYNEGGVHNGELRVWFKTNGNCNWKCSSATLNCLTCTTTTGNTVNTGISCSQPNPETDLTKYCANIPEILDNKDNNCNGQVDEGCSVCTNGETKACAYSGPSGTENKGICKAGTQTCVNGQWGACEGEVTPVEEVCGDNKDNNCDGNTDEGCVVCEDKDGDGYSAYNATSCPQGNDCNDFDIAVNPGATEACNTRDDNCNGLKDETCMGGSCSNISLGSTANPGSGNLYHDQTLFNTNTLGFTLSYNSLDNFGSPLGKGWTHNYNLLLFGGHDGSLGLKQGDGRIVYFRLNQGIYYPDAESGENSYILYNADNTYTLIEKAGTTYTFNSLGKLTSIKDRNNNTTTLTYTGDNLVSVIDPSGRTITLTYDSQNRISSVRDINNNTYTFTYTDSMLVGISTLNWSYSYDSNGQMLTKTDPKGYVTAYTYDANNRVISSIDPEGKTKSITYDQTTNTAVVTEKDGGVWTYRYDPLLNVTIEKTDPLGNVTTSQYDQYKNLISKTESDGSVTSYTYDEYGNMASVTDPAGNVTQYTYNEFGQVTSITDSQGNVTGYEYDSNGNQTAVTDSTGAKTQYQYDSKGNIIQIISPNGQKTQMAYDQFNNMISVTDPSGATTTFTYDSSGNMTSQTDASGNVTRFEYNSLNQLIKITDSQGNITTYSYDSNGNRTVVTDSNGKTTYYEYNYKGQLIKVTDPLGNITQYIYGGTGCASCGGGGDKLTAITDSKGQTTMYQYDSLGRLIKETDSIGNVITYSYDSKGNLITKTNADSNAITYTNDSLSRLTQKKYPDTTIEAFNYDAKGNLIYAGNQHIAYNLSYDSNGRLITSTDSGGLTVKYEYDAVGNRVKMIMPDGKIITYKYDSNNRLIQLISDAGTFVFAYDSLGRRIKLLMPNGTYVTYSYDASSRLTNLTHKTSNGSVIASFAYTHDKVGNRLSKTTPDKAIFYQYDALYRLTEALSSTPGYSSNTSGKGKGITTATQQQKEFYSYDAVGNRLISDHNRTYFYNSGNQLISENGVSYAYDKNGNLISKTSSEGITTYAYDYENRLTKVTTPNGTIAEFKYDPFGRRIEKKITENGITTTKRYFYDNEDILFEYDENGSIGNRYIHGHGIDEPLAMINNKGTFYYHADGLGSIVALTDKGGSTVQTYEYDSFGNLKDQKERIKQPYTYTAREWDKEIGLYFYRARYYDSKAGRFTSFDPILHSANGPPSSKTCSKVTSYPPIESLKLNPQKLNPYVYVNNPINKIDPSGLLPVGTVDAYLQSCYKFPNGGDRCNCYCQIATDFEGCLKLCNNCFSGKNPFTPYEACMCLCKSAEVDPKLCKCACKQIGGSK
ncbi:MAG: MopE-related protein [Thermodesulfovibrionales bacterium]